MQEYSIKRGYGKNLAVTVVQGLKDQFGVEPEKKGDHYLITYGALRRLEVWLGSNGKTLVVDTESDLSADDESIVETNRRFRKFLEQVTGYNAKERAKKAQKAD
jgi:hypothetical protein